MSKQERKTERKKGTVGKEEDVNPGTKIAEKGKKIKEDIDELIDEIDDVLEENAEEFVKNYVQKGGE